MQRQDAQSPPLALNDSSDTQQHSPYYPTDSPFPVGHSQATSSTSLWAPSVPFQPWTTASAPLTPATPEGESWNTVRKYYEQTSALPLPPQFLPKPEVEAELRSLTTATRMAFQFLHEDEIQRPAPDWSRFISGSPLPQTDSSSERGPPEASPFSSKDSQVTSPPAPFAFDVGSGEPGQGELPPPSTSGSECNLLEGWDTSTVDSEQSLQKIKDVAGPAEGQDDTNGQDQPRRKGRARMSQEKRRRLARRKEREVMMEHSLKGPSPLSVAQHGGTKPRSATTSSKAGGFNHTGPRVEIPRRRSETSACLSSSDGRRCAQDMPCVSCSVDEATRTGGPGRTLSTIASSTSMGTDRYHGPISASGSRYQAQDAITRINSPPSNDLNASFLHYIESLSISSQRKGSYPHTPSSSDSHSRNASRVNSSTQPVQRGHCCLKAARQLPCQHIDGSSVADRPSSALVATGMTRPDVWRNGAQYEVDERSSERFKQETAPLGHFRLLTNESPYPVDTAADRIHGPLDHSGPSKSTCPTAHHFIGQPRQHHLDSHPSVTGFQNQQREPTFERRRGGPELWSSDRGSDPWTTPPSRGNESLQEHVATFLDRLQRYQQQQQHSQQHSQYQSQYQSQHQRSLSQSNAPEEPQHPQYHLYRQQPQQMPQSYPPAGLFSPSALNQQERGPSLTHHQRDPFSYQEQSLSSLEGFHPSQRRKAVSQRQGDDYPPWRRATTNHNDGVKGGNPSPSTSTHRPMSMPRRGDTVPVEGNGRDRKRSPW